MSGRRNLIIVTSIVVAALATLLLVKTASSKKQVVTQKEPSAKVFLVREVVPQGTKGEDLARFVVPEEVPDRLRIPDAISSLDQLKGLIAKVDLLPREQVVQSRFGTTETKVGADIPPGLIDIAFLMPSDRIVGGRVEPGKDRVAIFASLGPLTDAQNNVLANDETHLMLHKVPVVNIQVPVGQAAPAKDAPPSAQDTIPGGSIIVTLAVNGPNAERLVFASKNGEIWMAREPNDAPEGGTKLVDRVNIWDDIPNNPTAVTTPSGLPADLPPDPNAPTTTTVAGAAGSAVPTTTAARAGQPANAGVFPTTTTIKRKLGVLAPPNGPLSATTTRVDTTLVRPAH